MIDPKHARYLERGVTDVRRRDRRLDDEPWIDRFLERAPYGSLAFSFDSRPFIHTNLFWYAGGIVYLHTGGVGRFRAMIEASAVPACFSVSEHGRILPASTPMDFSTEYASVVLYGTIEVVGDPAEKKRALEGLMAKYAPQLVPGRDYVPMPDSDIDLTSVFRIEVRDRIAKHNVKPADYPAYSYAGESFIAAEREAGRVTVKPKEIA
ncbi:MAG: pyridoxamine 5'-phosphate oxidase family protein [Gemmatimonadota bacterium]